VTSTVLDASLALLMISGAVLAVTGATTPAPPRVDRADAAAETLATTTGSVNYTLAPGARRANATLVAFPVTHGPAFRRSDHGTLAALLAEAAVGTLRVRDDRLTHTHEDFAGAVRSVVRAAIDAADVQVVAVWRPYPGAHLGGRVAVGRRPPPDATVHAATLAVPSDLPSAREDAIESSTHGYEAVARVVARRLVRGLFPPRPTRLALRGDYPVDPLVRYRYRRAAAAYGTTVADALERDDPVAANARLVEAAVPIVERELRRGFDSPATAADAVDVGTVRIVVRRWE
jgi:hypothetical protein